MPPPKEVQYVMTFVLSKLRWDIGRKKSYLTYGTHTTLNSVLVSLTSVKGSLSHLYMCRNVVSMWDTTRSQRMWACHMADVEVTRWTAIYIFDVWPKTGTTWCSCRGCHSINLLLLWIYLLIIKYINSKGSRTTN